MDIVFASGKGGTGKTTIAANLAWFLARLGRRVQYLDCDVEEPNGHLFLKPRIMEKHSARVMTPAVDQARCLSCGKCGEACRFHAIVNLPGNTLVFPQMCHGCGLCLLVCPAGAISGDTREIGVVEKGRTGSGISFVHGVLNVGEPMANPLIEQVKACREERCIHIIDAPPGTSCPVVKTMRGADAVVMVTEPTPFGLHDMQAAVQVARSMGIPVGVVVNREQGPYAPLDAYLAAQGLAVLARLPDDRQIARLYSTGMLICEAAPEYRTFFMDLTEGLGWMLGMPEGRSACRT
jgi:MinD superfamily P-loop ATPase